MIPQKDMMELLACNYQRQEHRSNLASHMLIYYYSASSAVIFRLWLQLFATVEIYLMFVATAASTKICDEHTR